jgi:threonine dehydratase
MAPLLVPTALVRSDALDEALGARVTLACETFQRTGSFKFRAAYNLLRSIPSEEIVTASSGNFGQAVALASRILGRRCTVVMPATSSRVKIAAVRSHGAQVDLVDTTQVSRMDRVRELMADLPGSFYAPAFDDTRVVGGNSTLGREILASGAEFDAVLVPVGGGGLVSGVVSARDVLAPTTRVYGAEPSIANDAARSLRAGEIVANEFEPQTIADGARTLSLGAVTWPIVQRGVEDIVEVPEATIAEATRLLFRNANLKAEPTGALAVGATLLSRERFAGQRICCVVSGGNVDEEIYAAILRGEL